MPNQYEYVDFMAYNGDIGKVRKICRVYLVKRKLVYEGEKSKEIKALVEKDKRLKPFRDIGGYVLLDGLTRTFKGSYFWATPVQSP